MRHCDPWQQRTKARIVRAEILRSSAGGSKKGSKKKEDITLVLCLTKPVTPAFAPPLFRPGMYAFICLPGLSGGRQWEWHPFETK